MRICRYARRGFKIYLLLSVLVPGMAWAGARARQNQPSCFERAISGHTDGIRGLAFLPDGVRFVSASADKTLKLWDSSTGELLRTFAGHDNAVLCVAVSPDGNYIASGSADQTVRVWEVKSGDQVAQLEGHTIAVTGVAFLSDNRLSSAGGDGFRLWDFKNEKLLAKSDNGQRISRVAYSKDGTRAGVLYWAGGSGLWDTVECKSLADLAGAEFITGVGISPDGKHVYYDSGRKWSRYDVETRQSTPLPDDFHAGESIAFTPDQKLLIASAGSPAYVWDVGASTHVTSLQGLGGVLEVGHAVAVSKDGVHVVYGTGGTEDNNGWHPGRINQIFVFDLRKLQQTVTLGPPEGSISWDVIPASVKKPDGTLVPLEAYFEKYARPQLLLRQAGTGRDVVWWWKDVFVHATPGVLEPLFHEELDIGDVAWDGKHFWVSGARSDVLVLDPSGKVVARAGAAQGLRSGGSGLTDICVLGEGRVLIAGAGSVEPKTPARGWCTLFELAPDGHSIKSTPIIEEPDHMPDGWAAPIDKEVPSLVPRRIDLHKTSAGVVVWVICDRTPQSDMPVVIVDVKTLAASLYNVPPPGEQFPRGMFVSAGPLCDLGDNRFLAGTVNDGIAVISPGPHSIIENPSRFVTDWRDRMSPMRLFEQDGQYLIPGTHWLKIDPADWTPENFGPGLRVDGELVERDVSYGESVHFGICAISGLDGAFYRFSWDPHHPLSVRATRNAPKAPTPAQEQGLMEYAPNHAVFWGGLGFIRVDAGRVFAMDFNDMNRSDYPPAMSIIDRLIAHAEERQRLGLSGKQLDDLKANRDWTGNHLLDEAKVRTLFAAVEKASDGAARKQAARPLFDEARAFAERKDKVWTEYTDRVRSILTPLQWKLASYEHLTPQDKAEAKALRASAPASQEEGAAAGPNALGSPADPAGARWPSVVIGVLGVLAIGGALAIKRLRGR